MAGRPSRESLAERIVETALDEAERTGWPSLRLHRVAARLELSLSELYRHFVDADAIAEAWLSRADRAMLARRGRAFARRAPAVRLEETLLAWLDALSRHRAVTRSILLDKLYPGHPHHLAALVFRLSRTVQWWREASLLDGGPPRRQIEEIALTWLFVATIGVWANDASPGQQATRRFLKGALGAANTLVARFLARSAS